MAGLLTVQRRGDSVGGSPGLPSTTSLMRQPSAEDLDAAHQLVSSARGRTDTTVMPDFSEGADDGTSIRPDQGGFQESHLAVNGAGRLEAGQGNSSSKSVSEGALTAKGSAPSGQTCRLENQSLSFLRYHASVRVCRLTFLLVIVARHEHPCGGGLRQVPSFAMPVAYT